MKRFKYLDFKRMISQIKTLNQRVLQLQPNPYKMLLDWVLDIVEYGFIATVAVLLIIQFKWIGLGLSFGLLLYLWKVILKATIKNIKD